MFHPELNLIANLTTWEMDNTRDGTYISLKGVHRAFICVIIHQGVDATVHTVTLKQATAGAGTATGTGEKAFAVAVPCYYNQTGWATSNLLTASTTSAVGVFTFGADQSVDKLLVIDIVPERDMDITNGFDCVSVNFSDLGAANSGGAFALLMPVRYAPMKTVYAD
jgi:hypothetical protein